MSAIYWEIYDDQSYEEFGELSYVNLSGTEIRVPTQPNLEEQVHEILRQNGNNTEIKVYRR